MKKKWMIMLITICAALIITFNINVTIKTKINAKTYKYNKNIEVTGYTDEV